MAEQKEFPIKNVIYIGGAIVGLIVVKKILETIGVLKTAEEKLAEQKSGNLETGSTGDTSTIDKSNPALSLNPNYYKTIFSYINKLRAQKKLSKLTGDQIGKILGNQMGGNFLTAFKNYAGRIYQSKGIFNDDESRLYSVFQAMPTQLQISYLSSVFTQQYKKDMLDYIKGFTNEEERAKIFDIVKNKPLY